MSLQGQKTASSIAARWTVFTELLPDNALIKFVTLCQGLKDIMNEKQESSPSASSH
jgi:hypothetical protein